MMPLALLHLTYSGALLLGSISFALISRCFGQEAYFLTDRNSHRIGRMRREGEGGGKRGEGTKTMATFPPIMMLMFLLYSRSSEK